MDAPDPPYTRRYAQGEGRKLIEDAAHQCAGSGNHKLFYEVLRLFLSEGTPEWETATDAFLEICRKRGSRGPAR